MINYQNCEHFIPVCVIHFKVNVIFNPLSENFPEFNHPISLQSHSYETQVTGSFSVCARRLSGGFLGAVEGTKLASLT